MFDQNAVKAIISCTLHKANGTKSHQILLLACLHQNQHQKSMSSLTWTDKERREECRGGKPSSKPNACRCDGQRRGLARRSRKQRPISERELRLSHTAPEAPQHLRLHHLQPGKRQKTTWQAETQNFN